MRGRRVWPSCGVTRGVVVERESPRHKGLRLKFESADPNSCQRFLGMKLRHVYPPGRHFIAEIASPLVVISTAHHASEYGTTHRHISCAARHSTLEYRNISRTRSPLHPIRAEDTQDHVLLVVNLWHEWKIQRLSLPSGLQVHSRMSMKRAIETHEGAVAVP